MKPYCITLINRCRNSAIFSFPSQKTHNSFTNVSSKLNLGLYHHCKIHSYTPRFLGFPCIFYRTQVPFYGQTSSWGQSGVFTRTCNADGACGGVNVLASVASNVRSYSSLVETCVNENNFERICVHGGMNVKPLVVERIDRDESIGINVDSRVEGGVENVSSENLKGLNEVAEVVKAGKEESDIEREAWRILQEAVVTYCGNPVGTVAVNNPADKLPLNYDQVFIRDFVPSALAFLLKGEAEIVRNFLLHTLQLQLGENSGLLQPGQGLMPASFKVRTVPLDENKYEEVLDPDFGESAIGRVAPVDSGLWWIILLRAYGKVTGDYTLQERVDVQTGIKLILNLCLSDGFDMFPSLLVTDGSCMIDRRMGIHGHPLEIQALFYSALRCSREMLSVDDISENLVRAINNRLSALSFHIREYYWVDMKKINEIYRYNTEEYSTDATNKFNIYPDQIPHWLADWIPEKGGYLIGNLQPAHMDFRFFTLGNLWSIVSSLGIPKQNESTLNLIEAKWDDLMGHMPLKICYPALEYEDWRIITGSDPKNTPWSYHNGGSWPTLLWQFTLACMKMGRPELARKALDMAENRLSKDHWPEYYDTRNGKFIGKQARLYQTWSVAGFLTSKMLLENPEMASRLFWDEDYELLEYLESQKQGARFLERCKACVWAERPSHISAPPRLSRPSIGTTRPKRFL